MGMTTVGIGRVSIWRDWSIELVSKVHTSAHLLTELIGLLEMVSRLGVWNVLKVSV
jgi:hypothetical protein